MHPLVRGKAASEATVLTPKLTSTPGAAATFTEDGHGGQGGKPTRECCSPRRYNSGMQLTVTAVLPFPIRLAGGPFGIATCEGCAELTFETVRRANFDERIVLGGTFDFQIDRSGAASYTRVVGVTETDSPRLALHIVLACVNAVICHLRDYLSMFWLGELERIDLFHVTVTDGRRIVEEHGFGRARGVTNPVEGLNADVVARLRERLQREENVVEWRLLQLDAEDAYDLAHYETATVLGWTALE